MFDSLSFRKKFKLNFFTECRREKPQKQTRQLSDRNEIALARLEEALFEDENETISALSRYLYCMD